MAKELTLENLVQSSSGSKKSKPAQQSAPVQMNENGNPIPTPANSGKQFRPISTSQLSKQQLDRHPEYAEAKAKAEQEVTAPLVESAFAAMESTIEERKKGIEENLVPILEKNAEALATEAMENGGVISDEDVPDDIRENIRRAGNLNSQQGKRPVSTTDMRNQKAAVQESLDENDDIFSELDDEEPANTQVEPEPKPDQIEYTNQRPNPVAARLAEQMAEPEDAKEEVKPQPKKEESKIVEMPKQTEDSSKSASTENTASGGNNATAGEDLDELMKDLGINDQVDLDDIEEESQEEVRERFKRNFSSVKIIKNPVDLGKFKIRQTATTSSAVLNRIGQKDQRKRSDWVLYYSGRSMTFEECKGPELDNLFKTVQNSNGVNGVIATLQFIYNHTIDANKPKFEQWTKLIRTEDIESLYFGLYKACYADANLVPRTCADKSCKKTSLIDCDINKMVKFENDEVKDKFYELFKQDTTTHSKRFQSTLLQISDDLVISYSEPTIYKTFIQYASLKDEVVNKYSDTLNMMAYIDNFFAIDRESGELIPMDIKEYPNDLGKTVLSKLKVFISVLKSLDNDEFNALKGKLNSILNDELKVTYIYPEVQCPECKATIPEAPIDSCMNLLFTRAQLGQITLS